MIIVLSDAKIDNKYIVSGSSDNTVRIWDINLKKQEAVLQGHHERINCVKLTSDDKYIISTSSDQTIRIWDFQTKRECSLLRGHSDSVVIIAITSDNKHIISGSIDRAVKMWSIKKSRLKFDMPGHNYEVTGIAVTSDGKYVVSGSADFSVMIWSTQDRKEQTVMEGIKNNAYKALIAGKDELAQWSLFTKTMRIWSEKDKVTRQKSALKANILTMESLAISSGNRYIALGLSNLTITVWKLQVELRS